MVPASLFPCHSGEGLLPGLVQTSLNIHFHSGSCDFSPSYLTPRVGWVFIHQARVPTAVLRSLLAEPGGRGGGDRRMAVVVWWPFIGHLDETGSVQALCTDCPSDPDSSLCRRCCHRTHLQISRLPEDAQTGLRSHTSGVWFFISRLCHHVSYCDGACPFPRVWSHVESDPWSLLSRGFLGISGQ